MMVHITPKSPLRSIAMFALLFLVLSSCKQTVETVHFFPLQSQAENCGLTQPDNFQDIFREMRFGEVGDGVATRAELQLIALAEQALFEPDGVPLPDAPEGMLLDSMVFQQWVSLLQAKAWQTDQFARLDSLARMDPTSTPADLVLPAAFAKADGLQKIIFEQNTFTVPITRSSTNSPIIEVEVNGKKYNFWVDTGAAVTVLSSQVADKIGISYLDEEQAEIGTSTKRTVQTQPALLDSIRIGSFKAEKHPCVVLDKKDLTFRFLGIRLLKIDGIVGWPLIKEMDMEINMPENTITIHKPVSQGTSPGNLGWHWQPIVRMKTPNGCSLNLHLDTGSGSTFFRPHAYERLGVDPKRGGPLVQGGAGGKEVVRFDKLDSCQFILGENLIQMDYAEGIKKTSKEEGIFQFDGVLGQDVLKYGTLRLDFTNRSYQFKPHQ